MKKIFTFLLAVASVGIMHAAVYSGTCGDNLTWELNTADSVLVISGSGQMNYSSYYAPWNDYSGYIQTVTIPSGVTTIGEHAFYDCENLRNIEIPNTVISIGSYAFSFCTGIRNLIIPNSVISIGFYAFWTVLNVEYTGTAYGSPWQARSLNGYWDGDMVYKDDTKTELLGCATDATGEISIASTVTKIGDYAFEDCKRITNIYIPASVNNIGYSVFGGCMILQAIEVETSNTSYFSIDGILYGGSVLYYMPRGFVGDYVMPDNISSIRCQAIENVQGLTSITFSKIFDTESWCEPRFETCENLHTAFFPCQNELPEYLNDIFPSTCSIINTTNTITQLPDTAVFYGEDVDGEPVYENGVHTVTYATSDGCDSIVSRNVTILYSVEIDGIYYRMVQYYGYRSMEVTFEGLTPGENFYSGNIVIPDSVEWNANRYDVISISSVAFQNCATLKSVSIPQSIISIGYAAFVNCTGLTSVTCAAVTPPTLDLDVFYNVECAQIPLYVPMQSVDLYAAADQWKEFHPIIGIEVPGDEEGIEQTSATTSTTKLLRDGQLLIERDGKIYTVTGQEVR